MTTRIVWVTVSLLLPCSVSVAVAEGQVQTRGQAACIRAANKAGANVARAQGQALYGCMRKAAAGALPGDQTAEDCLADGGIGKVAAAVARTHDTVAAKCSDSELPEFGFAGAVAINGAAIEQTMALLADVFGEEFDGALTGLDAPDARCQIKVQRAYQKVVATHLKEFLKCKKRGLRRGTVASPDELAACVGEIAEDPAARIRIVVDRLADTVERVCATAEYTSLFPGYCAPSESTSSLTACIVDRVGCRFCRMVNSMDGIFYDCDALDDDEINDSCPAELLPPETCSDGIQNQDETDVDCGGGCDGCPLSARCILSSDCTSICSGGICTCATTNVGFTVHSNTGGAFVSAQWPGGTMTHAESPECSVTVSLPTGNIDLVGLLGDGFGVAAVTGFSHCQGFSGEDGDGCYVLDCPPAGIGFCEATRPSCSAALNGAARAGFQVRCTP